MTRELLKSLVYVSGIQFRSVLFLFCEAYNRLFAFLLDTCPVDKTVATTTSHPLHTPKGL